MKPISVMVTGVGGAIGVSILKALRKSGLPCKIIGANFDPVSAGFYMVDKACEVPDVRREPQLYIEKIIDLCCRYRIQVVFPGNEAELLLLAKNKDLVQKQTGTLIIVNKPEILEIALDKWKTVQFLQNHGIPAPHSVLPDDFNKLNDFINQHNFPLIIKPRFSSGSNGLFIVNNRNELFGALLLVKDAVIQEYLNPPEQEYTVGVFMQEAGNYSGSIIFRRTLVKGFTFKAIVEKNPEIEEISKEAAIALGAVGPINIQLRATAKGPVIFEINPRISSSTVMRAHFGFNEPELVIKRFLLGENISQPQIKEGTALRFLEETYI